MSIKKEKKKKQNLNLIRIGQEKEKKNNKRGYATHFPYFDFSKLMSSHRMPAKYQVSKKTYRRERKSRGGAIQIYRALEETVTTREGAPSSSRGIRREVRRK